MSINTELSIIIPVYNNWNYTQYCLDFFKDTTEYCEIIVVDNGSTDNTNIGIQKYKNVRYIKNEMNMGFGLACNQGYKLSNSELVLFLNNDIKILNKNQDWLCNFIDDHKNITDTLIGPTGGLVDINNDLKFMYETNNKTQKINYMSGWCLMASRNTWNELILPDLDGPFDCKSFFAYFEDTDLSWRAQELNIKYELYQLPITHLGRKTSALLNTNQLYTKSKNAFKKKWNGQFKKFEQWK